MCIINRLYTSCPAACLQCSSEGYSVRFIHSTPANVGSLLRVKKDFSLVSECNRCGERKSEAMAAELQVVILINRSSCSSLFCQKYSEGGSLPLKNIFTTCKSCTFAQRLV
ncbi:hypothetical protein AMECASPLE_016502 [Ameca splendens]|uniref:Uncharacterized protein n=1 Tax=Ameca splendens TaxID=208324 RepID=A0ABV0YPL1_9TELE